VYLKALGLFVRHLSVLLAPILAAVVAVLLGKLGQLMTDPVGGLGTGLYSWIAQLCFMVAFGIAIVQASDAWRGRKATFDAAWDESRRKLGGIILAAVGFQLVLYVAQLLGSFAGGLGTLILGALAAFFLIYTIPAAAIGGLPGQFALSGSIRAVRANPPPAVILAIVYIVLTAVVPIFVLPVLLANVPISVVDLIPPALQAVFLGYLAFPFAKTYDDVAFRSFW
jgi:hypothetical protein